MSQPLASPGYSRESNPSTHAIYGEQSPMWSSQVIPRFVIDDHFYNFKCSQHRSELVSLNVQCSLTWFMVLGGCTLSHGVIMRVHAALSPFSVHSGSMSSSFFFSLNLLEPPYLAGMRGSHQSVVYLVTWCDPLSAVHLCTDCFHVLTSIMWCWANVPRRVVCFCSYIKHHCTRFSAVHCSMMYALTCCEHRGTSSSEPAHMFCCMWAVPALGR